ncbi:lipid-A-disaccharide synthase [Nevskia sp.]|uniref:lipid-A-disaccharide synthase n=1 Tax=Nevskia sp. TaxID=1929292 RepID=UPI0025F49D9A|nr:lipid-A-disaccharide synthase [Nevskia sp.]
MHFALIAGEASGDLLGGTLIPALKALFPDARFSGVTGPRMRAAGCETIASIDRLSVMGIAEVLPKLPDLFRLRAELVDRLSADRPDVVIGIDAPDFNLGLERRLRERGLTTVHLVSPTVWAWRQGRVKIIARSADLVLCLFPFEPKFYEGHGVRAEYVGHPLAEELAEPRSQAEARRALGVLANGPCLAVLPGSRGGELAKLAVPFAQTAALLAARLPGLSIVTPIAKPGLRPAMERAIAECAPGLDWKLVDGHSREAMRAADVVLLASGTATLECLLLDRPMVVGYRLAGFTAFLLQTLGMLKIRNVSLPNLLAAEAVVPEFLQQQLQPSAMADALQALLTDAAARDRQLSRFAAVRSELRRNAAQASAQAIAELIAAR